MGSGKGLSGVGGIFCMVEEGSMGCRVRAGQSRVG